MSLSFESRTLFASAPDNEGLLVVHEHQLVALLIRLSRAHDEFAGGWSIEWASHDDLMSREIFQSLDTASNWIIQQIGRIAS